MKIYTNEGNPLGFKMQILAKFTKREVSVEKANLNDLRYKNLLVLPTLELENGLKMFSAVAVAKYFFPNEGQQRDEWLEWSSTLLAPALAHHMGHGHRANPDAVPVLNALLKNLEEQLSSTPFLAGHKLTAADLSVWSLLAPDGTLQGAQQIDHLLLWYRKIAEMPEIKAILETQPLKDLTFIALQNSNLYGGLYHVPLKMPASSESMNVLADTGSTLADTLSDEELSLAKSNFVVKSFRVCKEPRTVLPVAGKRNVLVTSALPYVNNVPHLGNIIGCVLSADIFARYSRAAGYNTLFISGTDEYGTATENKALAENLTPREICDKYFELHNAIYRWFGIGFDYFGRTTTEEQTEIVQEAFKDVYDNGYILTQSVDQLLCQKCNRFLADRFVEGTCPHPSCGYEDARGDQCDKCGKLVNATDLIRPRCTVCNTAPVVRSSNQLFLDLPKIENKLREWVHHAENGWTNNARVITRAWLREGLKPRCITRDLKWGIPVPHKGFENKVFYVWFDAPFGYISMTKRYSKEFKQWWQPAQNVQVELFQFMAKDNVPFHSVVWPAALLAMNKGNTLVSHIMATEYLNYEDGKFSKSRGVGVFGNDAQDTGIQADVWRFYLASARPEGQDSSFSWSDLAARNNSELLNNLGNFVNRALVFCEKNFNGIVPPMNLSNDDYTLLALINRELRGYINSLEKARLRDGIRHLLSISRHGNGYMQSKQPWVLLKGNDEQKSKAGTIIGLCCNIACLLANLIFPYMPTTARTMFEQLNTKQSALNAEQPFISLLLPSGHKIGKPAPLFAKLDQTFIDDMKKKYAGPQVLKSADSQIKIATIEVLEKAIQQQGDKVRKLKASTKDKSVWQPEVNKLLDFKTQLTKAQDRQASQKHEPKQNLNPPNCVSLLESAIQVQGNRVRQIKDSTKDKTLWQPEIDRLLDLKKQLTEAAAESRDDNKIQETEKKIAAQADKVRTLKASSDASVWRPEVEVLLTLKKELAFLTGVAESSLQGKNRKKK